MLEETINKLLDFRKLHLQNNESYTLFRETVSPSFIICIGKTIKNSWFSQDYRIIIYRSNYRDAL